MAEEHRCQAPRLCVNNCGFFGSPATQNLCSKCYRDLQLKEQQSSSAKQALNQTLTSSSTTAASVSSPAVDLPEKTITVSTQVAVKEEDKQAVAAMTTTVTVKATATTSAAPQQQQTGVNRCLTCRRRVGLTGFKCRCGSLFCGTHRYPEQHECAFDFKEMGKEQIAKANPVVKAEKLRKI